MSLSLPNLCARRPEVAVLNLFRNGEQGAWYDPSDLTTLFQDSGGTTPVTATGQPVGKILDKSGRGNHATQSTTTSRPTLQQDGTGRYYLSFDGTDDVLATSSINFSASDKMTVACGARKLSDAAIAELLDLSYASSGGSFFLRNGTATAGGNAWSSGSRGSSGASVSLVATATGYTSPITSVLVTSLSISTDANVLRVNGVSAATAAGDQGSGNFGNLPLYIGRRSNGTLPFNGRIYSIVIRGATTSGTQLSALESYVNLRTGAY